MREWQQTTLARAVSVDGIGVHSGDPVTVVLQPAPAGTGIVFIRDNLPGDRVRELPARYDQVGATALCTVLGDAESGSVSTVEHLMAALVGLGVDNLRIHIDGPEVPIVDGSAYPFMEAIDEAGVVGLGQPRRYLKVLRPVRVDHGDAFGELSPADRGFRLETVIEFPSALIGRQAIAVDVDARSFRRELSGARTFGFLKDVERLWAAGFARGASMDNTVVLGEDRVLNAGGLRFKDEFVRHKAMDALGDLALAGMPIIGVYRSVCGGHRLNAAVLQALMADRTAFAVVETEAVRPARHIALRPALMPALAPEL